MEFYKFFPTPSDRMGTIWTLSTIQDAYVIEFGPAGTTHFAIEGLMQLNAEHKASVYTTHIHETDISFGKEDRLEKAILEIDGQYQPKYIFVMGSSISAIIGTDIESICFSMADKVQAKLIPINSGGYAGDHTVGIESTLELICKEIVQETENKKPKTYNIIGNNADILNFLSDAEEVKFMMKEAFGYELNTTFTAYTSIDELEKAGEAEFNLVLRGEGLKAAEVLKKNHGMEYYYGRPYGLEGSSNWLKAIGEKLGIEVNPAYLREMTGKLRKHLMSYKFMARGLKNKSVILVGDYDVVVGLADLVEELGLNVERIMVKHRISKKQRKSIPAKWEKLMDIDLTEREIEDYLSQTPVYLLMADEASLQLENLSRLKMQIANPNFTKYNIYPYTPFVGYKGLVYILQNLYELQRQNPEH